MHSTERDSACQVMGRLARLILALHVTLYQPLRSVRVLRVHQALANCAGQGRSCNERKGRMLKAAGTPCTSDQQDKAATHGQYYVSQHHAFCPQDTCLGHCSRPTLRYRLCWFNAEEALSCCCCC